MEPAQKAYLRVKIASLAAEAVIIRKAENKARQAHKTSRIQAVNASLQAIRAARSEKAREAWLGLKEHRRSVVRTESRSANIAYAFLSGRAYKSLEAKCWTAPNWGRVSQIVRKFAPEMSSDFQVIWPLLKAWRDAKPEAVKAAA